MDVNILIQIYIKVNTIYITQKSEHLSPVPFVPFCSQFVQISFEILLNAKPHIIKVTIKNNPDCNSEIPA